MLSRGALDMGVLWLHFVGVQRRFAGSAVAHTEQLGLDPGTVGREAVPHGSSRLHVPVR